MSELLFKAELNEKSNIVHLFGIDCQQIYKSLKELLIFFMFSIISLISSFDGFLYQVGVDPKEVVLVTLIIPILLFKAKRGILVSSILRPCFLWIL